jgi:hypothetical protein
MLLESFVIHKKIVNKVLLKILKFERAFYYSNLYQMFSNLLWALIYFIRKATFVYILNAHVLNPFNKCC